MNISVKYETAVKVENNGHPYISRDIETAEGLDSYNAFEKFLHGLFNTLGVEKPLNTIEDLRNTALADTVDGHFAVKSNKKDFKPLKDFVNVRLEYMRKILKDFKSLSKKRGSGFSVMRYTLPKSAHEYLVDSTVIDVSIEIRVQW